MRCNEHVGLIRNIDMIANLQEIQDMLASVSNCVDVTFHAA